MIYRTTQSLLYYCYVSSYFFCLLINFRYSSFQYATNPAITKQTDNSQPPMASAAPFMYLPLVQQRRRTATSHRSQPALQVHLSSKKWEWLKTTGSSHPPVVSKAPNAFLFDTSSSALAVKEEDSNQPTDVHKSLLNKKFGSWQRRRRQQQ